MHWRLFASLALALCPALICCKTISHKNQLRATSANDEAPDQLTLPSIISDGMVLQQSKPIPIWGKAPIDRNISVELLRADLGKPVASTQVKVSATNGLWIATLPAQTASFDAYQLLIRDEQNEFKFSNVLIGEVWLNSGQSNMELQTQYSLDTLDYADNEVFPELRLFVQEHLPGPMWSNVSQKPLFDVVNGRWKMAVTPADIADSSAIGYAFARQLYQYFKKSGKAVPVAMINTATGGAGIAALMSRKALESDPEFSDLTPAQWQSTQSDAMPQPYLQATASFNHKVAPLQNFAIRGVIWAQGETNVSGEEGAAKYKKLNIALIDDWREGFRDKKMPFLMVQLPTSYEVSCQNPGSLDVYAYTREAQIDAANARKNTYALPIYDINRAWDYGNFEFCYPVHTLHKRLIGERLANIATQLVYGDQNDYFGPSFDQMKIKDQEILISFKHVAAGLKIKSGVQNLHGFAIAGADRKFVLANARIVSTNQIAVSSPQVKKPVAVSYAFSSFNHAASLVNSLDLPALPFRSDRKKSEYARFRPTVLHEIELQKIIDHTSPPKAIPNDLASNGSLLNLGSAGTSVTQALRVLMPATMQVRVRAQVGPGEGRLQLTIGNQGYSETIDLEAEKRELKTIYLPKTVDLEKGIVNIKWDVIASDNDGILLDYLEFAPPCVQDPSINDSDLH